MDIEKMKRINELARELREQGITTDTEEAYRQAEKMVEGDLGALNGQDANSSSESAEKTEAREQETVKPEMAPAGAVKFDAFGANELNERINALEEQLGVLFSKMNEIISEINRLDKKKGNSPIELRDIEEKERKEEQAKEVQSNLKKNETPSHPRTGNYKPEDVSIEKMFYYGR